MKNARTHISAPPRPRGRKSETTILGCGGHERARDSLVVFVVLVVNMVAVVVVAAVVVDVVVAVLVVGIVVRGRSRGESVSPKP